MLCHRCAGSLSWTRRLRGNAGGWCTWRAIPTAGARVRRLRQELWQVVWPWVWNLRLGLGRLLEQDSSRSIEWALAMPEALIERAAPPAAEAEYGPLEWAQHEGRAKGGF